jgi:hypothetical protein
MAVTSPEGAAERERMVERSRRRHENACRQQPEKPAPEEQPNSRSPSIRKILGGVLAFAALAIYVIWLAKEMGGTQNGTGELAGVFAAILVALVALVEGAPLGGRGDCSELAQTTCGNRHIRLVGSAV